MMRVGVERGKRDDQRDVSVSPPSQGMKKVGRGKAPKPHRLESQRPRVYVRCGQRDKDLTAHHIQFPSTRIWKDVGGCVYAFRSFTPGFANTMGKNPKTHLRSAGLRRIQSSQHTRHTLHPSRRPKSIRFHPPVCFRFPPGSQSPPWMWMCAGQRKLRGQSGSSLVLLRRGGGCVRERLGRGNCDWATRTRRRGRGKREGL